MSTRVTLRHSHEQHLYQEGFDDKDVCLEIGSPQFESLIFKIPLAGWKEMRQHTIQGNEQYLAFTEDELRAEAAREVDAHRTDLDRICADGGKNTGLRLVFGSFVFESPDFSREELIQGFIDQYSPGRARQNSTV